MLMRALALYTLFLVLLCLPGCVTQDRVDANHLDALGHPAMDPEIYPWGPIEAGLRRLLVAREQKEAVFRKLGNQLMDHVPNAAYWNTFYRVVDGQPTNVSSTTRAEWKRRYLLSAETYVVWAEDGNYIIVYFDGSGRLWQYDHFAACMVL